MDTKRINRRNIFAAVIAVGIAVLVAGCQTMVPVDYTEPARLNMIGISRIAIRSDYSATTAAVSSALTGTGIYTVTTDDAEIAELEKWQEQQALLRGATEISASDLVNEYISNAVRANSMYKRKIVKVTGTVTEIKERAIRLGIGNDSVDVYIRKSENREAASLDKGASVILVGTCYGFDIPDLSITSEFRGLLGGGQHINITDATFYIPEYTGKIDAVLALETTTSVDEESKSEQHVDKIIDGKTIYKTVPVYRKVATATVAYLLTHRDGTEIGNGESSGRAVTPYYEKNRSKTEDSSKEDSSMLHNLLFNWDENNPKNKSNPKNKPKIPDNSTVIDSAMKKPLKEIVSDMIPTERTLSLRLAKSKSKDKKLKVSMKEAQILVKEKNYSAAADAYGEIYAQTKDFAAGYNQAIITEAAYGTSEAITLMKALANASGNPDAQNMLKAMLARDAANQVSAEQMNK